jgi:hypothetical protein
MVLKAAVSFAYVMFVIVNSFTEKIPLVNDYKLEKPVSLPKRIPIVVLNSSYFFQNKRPALASRSLLVSRS